MNLTPTEQAIRLALRRRKAFTATGELCREIGVEASVLKAVIWKMRKKGMAIETARGQGYKLNAR